MLQCPVCSRNGFQRLTRHLSQAHGIKKAEALERWPDLKLEIEQPEREIPCSECGGPVKVEGRAAHAKCDACRKTDDREKVACQICGVERRRLTAHLKSAHGLTEAKYRKQFPEALVEVPWIRARSAECRAKQSEAAKRRWASPEEREAQSERLKEAAPWLGKTLSDEHKQAISEGGKGVKHDVSPENRRKMGERGRKALEAIRDDPEVRAKLGAASERRHKEEPFGLSGPATLKKAREALRENYIKNGPPPNSGRGICGFRKGLNHYTRSTTEANFARVLVEAGVDYLYEPQVFRLTLASGKLCYYTPDFYLSGPLTLGDRVLVPAGWLEVKGWRHKDGSLPEGAQAKLDALQKAVEEPVNVLTCSDPEWEAIRTHWKPRVQWETQRRNLRNAPEVYGLSPE